MSVSRRATHEVEDERSELAALRERVARLERENATLRRWSAALERASERHDVEVWLLDEQRRVVCCNDVAARTSGRAPEELRGRPFRDGERAHAPEKLDVETERRGPYLVRSWTEPRPGSRSRRYVRVDSLTRVEADARGDRTTLLVIADITRRRDAERALLEQRRRLELALESASIGLWDWDISTGRLTIDLNACEVLGEDPNRREYAIEAWRDAMHPEDRARVERSIRRHLDDSDELLVVEYRARLPGGRDWSWLCARGRVQEYDRDGRPLRMLGSIQDITRRKQAAARLEESERRFRMLADNVPGVIYLCLNDERYRMTYINNAVEQLTGYTARDFLADRVSFVELYHPDDLDEIVARVDSALRRDHSFSLTYRLRHKSGEWRWIDEVGVGVLSPEGELLHLEGFLLDVTARKRAEADRELLLREFERKNRELERFAYTISHDLKSPLISIQSFAGLIERDIEGGRLARARADLQRIQRASADMFELLHDLLELSRIGRQIGARVPCSLDALARDVLDHVRGTYTGRDIEFVIAGDMPPAIADHARLLQLLQNLISNAIKYTDGVARARVELGWRRGRDGAAIYFVRDNGIGIAPEHAERVFGVFEQLDTSREGTGIGLTIARRISEVHGGQLWCESAGEGAGCTFFFTLAESIDARERCGAHERALPAE